MLLFGPLLQVVGRAHSCARGGKCAANSPPLNSYLEFKDENEDQSGGRMLRGASGDNDNDQRNLLKCDICLANKARWMEELYNRGLFSPSYGVRLRDLVLPGSHGSALIDFHRQTCDGNFKAELLGNDERRRVAKNQATNIYSQMSNHGMRFLDLRFSPETWCQYTMFTYECRRFPLQHRYYVKHAVNTVWKALEQVQIFLNNNPNEIVVISFRTGDCPSAQASHITKIANYLNSFSRLRLMQSSDLSRLANDLRGVGLVDIASNIVDEKYSRDWGTNPET